MRIVVLTNGNFFSTVCLKPLLRKHPGWVAAVYVTTGLRKQQGNRVAEAVALARRYGTSYFLYKLLTYAWFDAARVLLRGDGYFVRDLCRRAGIPCQVVRNVNDGQVVCEVQELAPDVIVSVSVPYRVRQPLSSCARVLAVNCHSSLLPAYAGVCTYVWALANNEAVTGFTVHELVERFDAGDIVAQEPIQVAHGASVFSLFYEQVRVGAELLLEAMEAAKHGTLSRRPQDAAKRTYFGEPDRAAIAGLRAHGFRLFRWQELVRAAVAERL